MDKVPSWMEKLLLPKLNEITGEIKAIHTRIDAVEKEIVSLRQFQDLNNPKSVIY